MSNAIATRLKLSEVLEEYDSKKANILESLRTFEQAGKDLLDSATIHGEYGGENISTGMVGQHALEINLKRSAWRLVWKKLNMDILGSAKDKKLFEQTMSKPPEFTFDNVKATFGPFIENPRENILRGLAEVFSTLDPAYKSHEKVKIGVQGLPKRIIITGLHDYGFGYGADRLRDILNAIASYQGKPLLSGYKEILDLLKDGYCLQHNGEDSEGNFRVGRGIWLKKFKNGNGHLFFDKDTLRDINMALAEFYGEVLPDTHSVPKKEMDRNVSKKLQYYPTPINVVNRIVEDLGDIAGKTILEPSCGCGRFMDALRVKGAKVYGVEVDSGRASEAREKGHTVYNNNFLQMIPGNEWENFDLVVMNPPFYGKHYEKHIRHALSFLKDGGMLISVLPITAKTDHKLLDDLRVFWEELPIGSFKESGTNINTCIATIYKRDKK